MLSLINPFARKSAGRLIDVFNEAQAIIREGHALESDFRNSGDREKLAELRELIEETESIRNWTEIILDSICIIRIDL